MPKADGIETIDAGNRLPAHELSEQLTQLLTERVRKSKLNRDSDPTLKSAGWSISMMTGGRVVSAALGRLVCRVRVTKSQSRGNSRGLERPLLRLWTQNQTLIPLRLPFLCRSGCR